MALAVDISAYLNGYTAEASHNAIRRVCLWLGGSKHLIDKLIQEIVEKHRKARQHWRRLRIGVILVGAAAAFAQERKIAHRRKSVEPVPISTLKKRDFLELLRSPEVGSGSLT